MSRTRSRPPLPAVAALALALGAALTACTDGGGTTGAGGPPTAADPSTATQEVPVAISAFIFAPDPLTVAPGATVRFENLDGTTHTVTAGTREAPRPEVIDASLAEGEVATWTLDQPGTYDYFCRLHSGPGMTGRIVVA